MVGVVHSHPHTDVQWVRWRKAIVSSGALRRIYRRVTKGGNLGRKYPLRYLQRRCLVAAEGYHLVDLYVLLGGGFNPRVSVRLRQSVFFFCFGLYFALGLVALSR